MKAGKLISDYFALVQFNPQPLFMRMHLKRVAGQVTGDVLDIGAGDVPYGSLFSNAGNYITTNTKRHYSDEQVRRLDPITDHWIDDGTRLPFQDGYFDCVCCFQVLSVIERPEELFHEAARVLKSGGLLLLSTDFLYPTWSREDRWRHTAAGLELLATRSGFADIKVIGFGGVAITDYMLWQNFIRDYPSRLKKRFGIPWLINLLLLPFLMVLSPMVSVLGLIIFLAEMGLRKEYKYSFNLLLQATKPQESDAQN